MPQNDFGLYFHQSKDSPLCYCVRNDHNKLHDIVYIASYIHEATFSLAKIERQNKRVVFNLDRVRWELFKQNKELTNTRSQLVFHNIKTFSIAYKDTLNFRRNKVEIQDFCFFENAVYIKTTFDFCTIKICMPPDLDIVLTDCQDEHE